MPGTKNPKSNSTSSKNVSTDKQQVTDEWSAGSGSSEIQVGSLFSRAWEMLVEHANLWLAIGLLAVIPSILILIALRSVFNIEEVESGVFYDTFTWDGTFAAIAIAAVIAGLYQAFVYSTELSAFIRVVRDKKTPSFSEAVNKGLQNLVPLILLFLVLGLIVIAGLILLVIPGIIAAFLLSLSPYVLVDKQTNITDALKTSKDLVAKNWTTVLIVGLAVAGINILVSIPVSAIASAATAEVETVITNIVNFVLAIFSGLVFANLYFRLSKG